MTKKDNEEDYNDIVKELFEEINAQREMEKEFYAELLTKLQKIEKRPFIVRWTANKLFKLDCTWKFIKNELNPDEYKTNMTLLNAYNQYLNANKVRYSAVRRRNK